ncbi:MAG: PQQ-binding-like beta-propeller repeat protein [Haloarculaceae archaeon]
MAFRRAVLLNVTAGRIARFDDVFTEEILKATGNAALKTIGTLAPTPPDPDDDDGDGSGDFTPAEITQSVVVGGLTVAGSVSGLALAASAAITLVGAVNAISEWGETVQEAASSIEDLQLLDLQVDGRCEPGNPNPQCCQNVTTSIFDNTCGADEPGTTLLALAELSRFQAREATRALAAGESGVWERHRRGYVSINEEIVDQLDIIRNEIDEAKPQGLEDTKTLLGKTNDLLRQEGTGRTDAEEIIDEISTRFRDPTAAITLPDTETVVAGEPVTIEADASASPFTAGEIDSHEWSFDPQVTSLPEGASITGDPIEITFAEPGTYEVTLTVETTEGKTVTTTRRIDVEIGQVGLDADAWPMAGGTPTHTSYAPRATPPTEEPGTVWTAAIDGSLTTTPAVVGERAYVGGEAADGGGVLVAVDVATGEEQWRAATERPIRASPAVVDGTVYVGDGGDGRGTVYAFDADAGEPAWTTGVGGTRGHVTATDTSVYVHAADQVVALAAGDGAVRWTRRPRGTDDYPPAVYGGPVVAGDRVFSSVSGDFASDFSTNDDPGVLAMAAGDGARAWRFDFGDGTVGIADSPTGSPAVAAGTVYAGEALNRFYALAPGTGRLQWEVGRPTSSGAGALAEIDPEAVAVTDGTVYAAGPGSDSFASPSLVALDAESGANRWATGLNDGFDRVGAYDVLVADDTVYVADPFDPPRLRAVRAGDGSVRWSLELDAGVRSLAAAGDRLFATTTAGDLRALGAAAVSSPDVTGDGNPATDPDGDGLYEDVNGDGNVTPGDASMLFNRVFESDPAVTENVPLFDFSGDGSLTPGDAAVLFEEIF